MVFGCFITFGVCVWVESDVVVRYTVTRRGAPALLMGGFGFVARTRRGARVYWTCRERRHGCRARAVTAHGALLQHHAHHNHLAQVARAHAPEDEHARIESLIETIPPPTA